VGTLLAACPPGARRDLYLITIGPDAVRQAQAHPPGSIEHIVVMSGAVRCGPVGQTVDLNPRDYASFPGDVPHVYEGLADNTALAMVMEHTSR
jgi:quercetin dioxygenase-like cupin family protein